jgi:hypothetical protein
MDEARRSGQGQQRARQQLQATVTTVGEAVARATQLLDVDG